MPGEPLSPVSWTVTDLEARLNGCRDGSTLALSGTRIGSDEVRDLLSALGLEELTLARLPGAPEGRPSITRTDTAIAAVGKTTLFDIQDVTATAAFSVEDAVLSVALTAEFPETVRVEVPFIKVRLGKLAATVSTSGPPMDLPIVSTTMRAVIEGVYSDPIPVSLGAAPSGGWRLRAENIRLPSLTAVAELFGRDTVAGGTSVTALIPPDLGGHPPAGHPAPGGDNAGTFSIAEFSCVFDPDPPAVRSIFALVVATTKERTWDIAPPFFKIGNVALALALEFPGPSADDVGAAGAGRGEPTFRGSVSATLEIGTPPLTLPVRLAREGDEWRLGVHAATGFPSLGELIGLVSRNQAVVDSLPEGVRHLRLGACSFEATLGPDGVRSIFFDARLAEHWKIADGIEVEDARFQLDVDRTHDDIRGFFAGTIRLGEVEVPVAVRKPGNAEPWMLSLGCSRRLDLGGVSSLARLTAGADNGQLPDLTGASLSLSEFTVRFDAKKHSVMSIALVAALTGAWSPPDLADFDVRDVTLKVNVDRTASRPQVHAALSGTVDVAHTPVAIAARWDSA